MLDNERKPEKFIEAVTENNSSYEDIQKELNYWNIMDAHEL